MPRTQSTEDEVSKWSCKCGKLRTIRPGGCYNNFVLHVIAEHYSEHQLLIADDEFGSVEIDSHHLMIALILLPKEDLSGSFLDRLVHLWFTNFLNRRGKGLSS